MSARAIGAVLAVVAAWLTIGFLVAPEIVAAPLARLQGM